MFLQKRDKFLDKASLFKTWNHQQRSENFFNLKPYASQSKLIDHIQNNVSKNVTPSSIKL